MEHVALSYCERYCAKKREGTEKKVRQREGGRERERERGGGGETDRQTDRQTDRHQTDRHQTDRDRNRERVYEEMTSKLCSKSNFFYIFDFLFFRLVQLTHSILLTKVTLLLLISKWTAVFQYC